MKHKSIQKKLLRYLDDDLPVSEKAKVRRHLEGCRFCRNALKTAEWVWSKGRPVQRETCPPFLWARIYMQLESEQEHRLVDRLHHIVRPALRPMITLVVLLFIFLGGIKLGNLMTVAAVDRGDMSTYNATEDFGLSYFKPLPPGSVDARALALTEREL
jgi:hypothetical protein